MSMDLGKVAEIISKEFREALRGVIHLCEGRRFLIFGSDNYMLEPRTKKAVQAVRAALRDQAKEIGFATDSFGDTWVLLIELEEPMKTLAGINFFRWRMTFTMWDAWRDGDPNHWTTKIEQDFNDSADNVIDGAMAGEGSLLAAVSE